MGRVVPPAILEACGPITRGRLLAVQLIADDLVLEDRLQRLTDMNLAFAGGDVARRHADDLSERRRKIHEALHPEPAPVAKAARLERTVDQVRQVAAMFGRSL